ncbi:MAG: ABC transporter substrate-binding protein [Proteobacteria bacterium]|nr:ABC transporter substrate-binding protein [Pseudomonadota bacterium]
MNTGKIAANLGSRTRRRGARVWLLVVLALFLPRMAIADNQDNPHAVTLQLPWFHQFQFAGYYAALEQGYYEEAGLTVTIKEGRPGMWPVEEVLHGRAQFGVGRSEILLHRLKGEPVVALAAVFQHSAIIFLARQDSGIATPQDMIGRTVMLLPGDDAAEHRATLRSEGVDLAKVDIIPSSFDIHDLVSGKTDVFNAYISNEPFFLKEQGVAPAIIKPITYGIDFYGDTLFTSELEEAKYPQQVKAFRAASLKGWLYALEHQEEIITLLREKYGVHKSLAHLRFEAAAINDLVKAPLVEIGHMNPGRWQHMADTYVALGMAEPGYALQGFIYDPDPRPDYARVITISYLLLGCFVAAAVVLLLLFNRRLNKILHETQEALLKKEKLYRFLFDNAPVGIVLADEEGTVHEINNEALAISGYQREDTSHIKVTELYRHPEDRKKLIERVKKEGLVKGMDLKMERRDGSRLDVCATSVGVMVEKQPYMLTLFEDVSKAREVERERITIQDSLHRMQKMEAIGLMASGVAHDLNNILSGIVSYPELILMQLPADSPFRKSITEIQKSGQRAAAVVADLLTVARGVASVRAPHNINDLLQEYLDSPECRQLKMEYGNVICSTCLDPDLANIACSPVHVKKCLMNLITNAAEAIKGEGCVDLSTRNEVVLGDKGCPGLAPGEYVVVRVADTGPGISEKDQEHIFEPFYTRKVMGRSGTGLGLAVVWNTMQDHNGAIDLQSSAAGTIFDLYFPVCHDDVVVKGEADSPEKLEGEGQTILVIDDEPQQRDIASQMLASLGYKVQAVSSGEEAVAYMKDHKVDLLLLDMIMAPGMNGRETYEEIIKSHPGQKAVICSGFSRNEEVEKAHELGAGGFLKKPYARSQLGRTVQRELAR